MANRTVLLAIDDESQFDRFGDYGPGIWQATISKTQDDRDASFWGAMGGTWSDTFPLNEQIVGSVKDADSFYPEVFNQDELFVVAFGFYFDADLQIVYIKFEHAEPWYLRELLDYGASALFIDAAQYDESTRLANQAYIDGIYAEPRIVPDSFSYTQTASPIENNRMTFDDCSITLINADGLLDDTRENSIGRAMRVFYSSLPDGELALSLSDYVQAFSGTVKSVAFAGGDTVTITGGDHRASWGGKVFADPLTLAEFPDMTPDMEHKYKNIVVGQLYRVPCINVSEQSDNKTWSVNSVINGEAVMQALYDGDPDEFTPINPSQYTYVPGTGVVTINKALKGELRADILGAGVTSRVTGSHSYKAVDIALAALDVFGGLPYIDSFWAKDDINIIYDRSPIVGIFIGTEGSDLKGVLDKVLSSANTQVYITGTLDSHGVPRSQYSMRDMYFEGFGVTAEIKKEDLLELPMSWGFDESVHMTSIAVRYVPRIFDEDFTIFRDDSLFDEAYINTPIVREYTYTSHCTVLSEVEILAHQRYKEAILVPYRLRGVSGAELEFSLLDYVKYHHVRTGGKSIMEPATWRVTKIDRINRTFSLALVAEDAPKDIYAFTADMFGPDVMYNDSLNANIKGEYV